MEALQVTPYGYKLGDRLSLPSRSLTVVITQCYISEGVWQIVLTNPITGHDVCRATEAEVRQHCYSLEVGA